MQLSVRKLAIILVGLLIAVTVSTSLLGLYVVQQHYRTAENRFDADAQEQLRHTGLTIRNQLRFYRAIAYQLAKDSRIRDLAGFGDASEIAQWSASVRANLPDMLGLTIAGPDGEVQGDPLAMRIGPACQRDLHALAIGQPVGNPPLHNDQPGLEHIDLLAQIYTDEGTPAGHLFVSFRLSALETLLADLADEHSQWALFDHAGKTILRSGTLAPGGDIRVYRRSVPDTNWELQMEAINPGNLGFYTQLILTDLGVMLLVGVMIALLVRRLAKLFQTDLTRIHRALVDVHRGTFDRSHAPTALYETARLLPDIENLAALLQQRAESLRQQSLTDPLTELHNRRYFDVLLHSAYRHSGRNLPAALAIIDINGFKAVNDELGHERGDRLLCALARLLTDTVRHSDHVIRLGGDEFALILDEMAVDHIAAWFAQLVQEIDRQLPCQDDCDCAHPACPMRRTSISVGVALLDSSIYRSASDAYRAADDAMYTAKKQIDSGSRYVIAQPSVAIDPP